MSNFPVCPQNYSSLDAINSQQDQRSTVAICWFRPLRFRLGSLQSVRPAIFIGSIGVRLIILAFPLVFDYLIMLIISSIIIHRKGKPIWTQPVNCAFSSLEWNWPRAKRSSPSSERPWRRQVSSLPVYLLRCQMGDHAKDWPRISVLRHVDTFNFLWVITGHLLVSIHCNLWNYFYLVGPVSQRIWLKSEFWHKVWEMRRILILNVILTCYFFCSSSPH